MKMKRNEVPSLMAIHTFMVEQMRVKFGIQTDKGNKIRKHQYGSMLEPPHSMEQCRWICTDEVQSGYIEGYFQKGKDTSWLG